MRDNDQREIIRGISWYAEVIPDRVASLALSDHPRRSLHAALQAATYPVLQQSKPIRHE